MSTDDSQRNPMTNIRLTPEDRAYFFALVNVVPDEDSCWAWKGSLDAYGYGVFFFGGRTIKATHLALSHAGKPRPGDACALHRCDNPRCVRPTHLRWGTQRENIKDMDSRGRRVPPKGSRHARAKLTEADVVAIRASALRSGLLAKQFGVRAGTIRDIRSRRRGAWRHI